MRLLTRCKAWASISIKILICASFLVACAPGPNKALRKCERWAELYPEQFSQADTLTKVINRPGSVFDTVVNLRTKDPGALTLTEPQTGAVLTLRPARGPAGDSIVYIHLNTPPRIDTVRIPIERFKLTPRGPIYKDKRAYIGFILGFIIAGLLISWLYFSASKT